MSTAFEGRDKGSIVTPGPIGHQLWGISIFGTAVPRRFCGNRLSGPSGGIRKLDLAVFWNSAKLASLRD